MWDGCGLACAQEVADALHVDKELLPAAQLVRKVGERVRRVAHELVRHKAGVGAVLGEHALQKRLHCELIDDRRAVGAAARRRDAHHRALDKVDRLGNATLGEALGIPLGGLLQLHVVLEQRGRVRIARIVLGNVVDAGAAPSARGGL